MPDRQSRGHDVEGWKLELASIVYLVEAASRAAARTAGYPE